jgi:hypothetical protein
VVFTLRNHQDKVSVLPDKRLYRLKIVHGGEKSEIFQAIKLNLCTFLENKSWISGTQSVNHPLTWAACIRYSFSNLIANK